MAYTYVVTHDRVYREQNPQQPLASIPSPYNFLSENPQNFFSMTIPVSMTLTTVIPDSETPFHITIFSPGYYLYAELDQNEYKQQVLNRGQHLHSTYEIVYTREGEFYQQIEARRYKYTSRSCCLLNRNIRHKEEFTTAFSTINLSLSVDFLKGLFSDEYESFFAQDIYSWKGSKELEEFFDTELNTTGQQRKSYLNFNPVDQSENDTDPVHEILDQMAHILIDPSPGCSFVFRGLIRNLLCLLSDQTLYSTKLINLGTETESKVFAQITHLMEQTHGRIGRGELTDRLNYSGNYLNRVVNKYAGMNILQYGNYFTVRRAAWLLTHTDMTVSQIILELGFSDRTHFYRLFQKEFGETPRQFRANHR